MVSKLGKEDEGAAGNGERERQSEIEGERSGEVDRMADQIGRSVGWR